MSLTTPPAFVPSAVRRPLFDGFALVAACIAWLAGMALRPAGPWRVWSPWLWGGVALACAAIAVALALHRRTTGWQRPRAEQVGRLLLVSSILACWMALGAARATWGDPASDPHSVALLPHNVTIQLRGDVAAEPTLEANGRLLTIQVASASTNGGATSYPASGRIEVHLAGPDDWFAPSYGDTLELTGTLRAVTLGAPAGVLAELTGARARIISRGGGNPLAALLFDLRLRLADGIQRALPEPEAALLIGILLGLKTPVLRARLALFTSTGTIHLVVPAGLKVSLLADIARRVATPLGRWTGTLASLLAVAGYAALGGGGPAAVRAAIMGALLALAPALGRRYDVFAALALTVLVMTAIEPLLLYDAGFQLTALATLGIPLLAPTLAHWLRAPLARLPFASATLPVAELLAVTIAAQLATLPVLALTFGIISFVAPLANLLAVPLLAPLLVLGGLLSVATLVALPLATWVGYAVWPLLWAVDKAIEVCAALPGAALAVSAAPLWLAWSYYLVLGGVVLWCMRRARQVARQRAAAGLPPLTAASGSRPSRVRRVLFRWSLVAVSAVVLLATVGAASPVLAAARSRIDFLDLGPGGEATLVRLASGTTVLIDGGPSGPPIEEALSARLAFWQRSLDLALLTDPRAGDAAGLQDVAAHYTIGRAGDAGMLHPTADYLAWLDALSTAGVPHTRVRQDDIIHIQGDTTLTVLGPPQTLYLPSGGASTQSNDLILRLDTPGLRVLLLGSADDFALDALLFAGESLTADVVEVALPPNTGVDLDSPLGKLLLAAHPRLVIVTQAPKPVRPQATATPTTIWPPDAPTGASLGALIVRTSSAGTISLASRPDGEWDLLGS